MVTSTVNPMRSVFYVRTKILKHTYRYKAWLDKQPGSTVPAGGHTGADYGGAADTSYISVDSQRL